MLHCKAVTKVEINGKHPLNAYARIEEIKLKVLRKRETKVPIQKG
jgi:hypothetical protein